VNIFDTARRIWLPVSGQNLRGWARNLVPFLLSAILVLGSIHLSNITVRAQERTDAKVVFLGAGKPSDACLEKLQILSLELRHFMFPADWTLAVACDPMTWGAARRRAGFPPTLTAFTGLKPRLTILNGAIFVEQPSFYEHTLAHELGHIRCNCSEESRAEDMAIAFLKSARYLSSLRPATKGGRQEASARQHTGAGKY
jgi:hypothetical protein